ncbi:MAG: hypothetical protein AABZ78_12780 [Chloroflexota bacterium]
MSEETVDPELAAIQSILAALELLSPEARQRVIKYVFHRLELSIDNQPMQSSGQSNFADRTSSVTIDIRSLKDQKLPRSDSEMAALVAYYLAELAPVEARTEFITKEDVEKYFKQAGYPLPKVIKQALPNAAKAGFLDLIGGGKYRLNPVGYNLVAHALPAKNQSKQ